jgi:hypothetical protein
MGLPLNRRDTTAAVKAEVAVGEVDGEKTPQVVIEDKVIYRPAPANGKTSQDIAAETADMINALLDADLQMYELRVDPMDGRVSARGKTIMVVSRADAQRMGKTPSQVAQAAAAAIRDVVWKQLVETIH